MDFGKLPSVEGVDFGLPPEPAQNALLLTGLPAAADRALHIGATGYNMKTWVGKWYPPGARDRDFLLHYGRQFSTIEHNTTHYRIPDETTVARWREETPEDFRFCPKIPQTISHAADLGLSGGQIELFCRMIAGLEEKLGCCFIQLPPYFSTRDIRRLERFLDRFSAYSLPLAVEVRHESFFKYSPHVEDYYTLLQERRAATVITDVAGRRDVCHMRLTGPRVLIRFVGNALHPSDYTRIAEWADRLGAWFDKGLKEAYFFTHEPDNLLAPELAEFVAETFAARMPGVRMRGPAPVEGQQGTLF